MYIHPAKLLSEAIDCETTRLPGSPLLVAGGRDTATLSRKTMIEPVGSGKPQLFTALIVAMLLGESHGQPDLTANIRTYCTRLRQP